MSLKMNFNTGIDSEQQQEAAALAANEPLLPETDKSARRPTRRRGAAAASGQSNSIPSYYAFLFAVGMLLLIGYYVLVNPNHKPARTLELAALVMGLGSVPAWWFLKRGTLSQVPVLEAHCMFYALCFGLPGVLPLPEMTSAMSVDETDMQRALLGTSLGLLALLAGYYWAGSKIASGLRPLNPGQGISLDTLEWLGWGGCVGGIFLDYFGTHFTVANLTGQIAGKIYTLGFYLLLLLALGKQASGITRMIVFLVLLPLVFFLHSGISNGQLAGVVTLLCWISMAIMRTRKRIPVELLVFAFLFFIVLQPVKFYVRELAWGEGVALGPIQTVQAYMDGFMNTYGSVGELAASKNDTFEQSFSRINHLSTTAAIMRDTPALHPYIWGGSYLPLLTKMIPRFLWPDKPDESFGNSWTHRYGYLGENDSSTSFNLPWLPEMYMNFGWFGIIGVMFLLGLLYRCLWVWLMGQATTTIAYVIALVFSQSMIISESNLSMQLGGLIILSVMLWLFGHFLMFSGIIKENSGTRRQKGQRKQGD